MDMPFEAFRHEVDTETLRIPTEPYPCGLPTAQRHFTNHGGDHNQLEDTWQSRTRESRRHAAHLHTDTSMRSCHGDRNGSVFGQVYANESAMPNVVYTRHPSAMPPSEPHYTAFSVPQPVRPFNYPRFLQFPAEQTTSHLEHPLPFDCEDPISSSSGATSERIHARDRAEPVHNPQFHGVELNELGAKPASDSRYGSNGYQHHLPESHAELSSNSDHNTFTTQSHQRRLVQGIPLVSTRILPDRFRLVFPYPCFNAVQSKCFSTLFEGNDNFVVSSPTGSGKTVMLELSICRAVTTLTAGQFKIVYQAPTKALCSERLRDWEKKFAHLDLKCAELTGDTTFSSLRNVQHADIIITTPEKWDSVTRKWRDHERLMRMVRLFLIDEVHILKEERGAILEAVVSRMCSTGSQVRFIALSATIPNLEDIAAWLGRNHHDRTQSARFERFGEEFRPVQVEKHVYGYNVGGNDFVLDRVLDSKLPEIISRHSQRKPIMIFCATRSQTVSTAKSLAQWWSKSARSGRHWEASSAGVRVLNNDLQSCLSSGVAFHHAGLELGDRQRVEAGFTTGTVCVICCTSTLAVGINLPCHFVIIKNTLGYVGGTLKEYTDLEIMQMLGRAGRPQFDDSAVAVIMTRQEKVRHYQNLVTGHEILESCLHKNLIDHLNAEIGLGSVKDLDSATKWLSGTFLYVRMQKHPSYYKLPGDTGGLDIRQRLEQFCKMALKSLSDCQLIIETSELRTTDLGEAMTRYYVQFQTMKRFLQLGEQAKVSEILNVLCSAEEFQDLRFRSGERTFYKLINNSHNIKYPVQVNLELPAHKVSLIMQSVLGSVDLPAGEAQAKHFHQNNLDKTLIFQHAQRLIRCIIDCQIYYEDAVATRNALTFARSIAAKVWDDSPAQMTQIASIGNATARKLVAAGIRNIEDLELTDTQRLEMIMSRNPPFGAKLHEKVRTFPKLRISLAKRGSPSTVNGRGVRVHVKADLGFLNDTPPASFQGRPVYISFLAGDSEGRLLHFCRISAKKLGNGQEVSFDAMLTSQQQSITCYVMCDEQAGTMREATLHPHIDKHLLPNKITEESPRPKRLIYTPHGDKTESNTSRRRSTQPSIEPNQGSADLVLDYQYLDDDLCDTDLLDAAADEQYVDIDDLASRGPEAPRIEKEASFQEMVSLPSNKPAMVDNLIRQIIQPRADGRWDCAHKCKDKTKCHHLCCREGLDHPPKRGRSKALSEKSSKTKLTDAEVAWVPQPVREVISTAALPAYKDLDRSKASSHVLDVNKPQILRAPLCSPIPQIAQLDLVTPAATIRDQTRSSDTIHGHISPKARTEPRQLKELSDMHEKAQKRAPPASLTNIATKKARIPSGRGSMPKPHFLARESTPVGQGNVLGGIQDDWLNEAIDDTFLRADSGIVDEAADMPKVTALRQTGDGRNLAENTMLRIKTPDESTAVTSQRPPLTTRVSGVSREDVEVTNSPMNESGSYCKAKVSAVERSGETTESSNHTPSTSSVGAKTYDGQTNTSVIVTLQSPCMSSEAPQGNDAGRKTQGPRENQDTAPRSSPGMGDDWFAREFGKYVDVI